MKQCPKYFKALILGLAILTACVPAKEFQALQDKNAKCEEEREKLTVENEALTTKNSELDSKTRILQAKVDALTSDSINRAVTFNRINEELATLKERYAELQNLQDGVISGSKDETKKLLLKYRKPRKSCRKRKMPLKNLSGGYISVSLGSIRCRQTSIA